MPRATYGVARRRKKKRVFQRVKGMRGGRSTLWRTAQEVARRSDVFATKARRKKKGDWRRVWIVRISAACRSRGIRYSEFVHGLKKAQIDLNRKVLADIALRDPDGFADLVERARGA
jgi:large subunit ribosomal protein L20